MYNSSTLNAQSLACINKLTLDCASKPEVLIMGMARAISAKLPMPSSVVESTAEYFSMFCEKPCRTFVSCMSDIMAFDTQAAADMVRTMWTVRYKAAYPADIIYDVPGACSEASFLGYGTAISAAQIKFIQENNIALIATQNNMARIICDLLCQQNAAQESLKAGKK